MSRKPPIQGLTYEFNSVDILDISPKKLCHSVVLPDLVCLETILSDSELANLLARAQAFVGTDIFKPDRKMDHHKLPDDFGFYWQPDKQVYFGFIEHMLDILNYATGPWLYPDFELRLAGWQGKKTQAEILLPEPKHDSKIVSTRLNLCTQEFSLRSGQSFPKIAPFRP